MTISLDRLKQRRDFLRVAAGRRAARPGLVLQARAATVTEAERATPDARQLNAGRPDDAARVGFTATRKIGNAVARNRARRRLRAAAAQVLPDAARAGHDYVLVARAGTLTRRFADLIGDLDTAMADVHRERTTRPRRGPGAPA